jgi:hypothetical protein
LTTARRYAALAWFANHEADPTAMLFVQRPTTKMYRLMLREGHLIRLPNDHWILSAAGREILAQRPKRKTDATRTEPEDPAPGSAGQDEAATDQ